MKLECAKCQHSETFYLYEPTIVLELFSFTTKPMQET